jgi:biotin carboxyl carrier protein
MLDAMKCFSELPAPVTGRLSEMLVANGSLADVDETICFIVPSGDEE